MPKRFQLLVAAEFAELNAKEFTTQIGLLYLLMRILLVEDDAAQRKPLTAALTHYLHTQDTSWMRLKMVQRRVG